MELSGSVVWVTGASSGIGEALVHALAKAGARVVLSARREEELRRVRQEAGLSEADSLCLPLDLASGGQGFEEACQAVVSRFGRIDALVNNGGIGQRSRFLETDLEVVRRLMEVNFFGTAALTKAVLPIMVAQGGGMLVAVTSVVGKYGTPLRSAYAASKHALHGLYDAIRAETWNQGIRVMLVAPGYIRTNLSYHAVLGDGQPQGRLDPGQANGLEATECARQILQGLRRESQEIYPAGLKELAGVYLKRFFPKLMSRVVRRVNVR
jgi:short-subunit dehydrogenase